MGVRAVWKFAQFGVRAVDPATVDVSFENNTLMLSGTKQPSVVAQEKDELRVCAGGAGEEGRGEGR